MKRRLFVKHESWDQNHPRSILQKRWMVVYDDEINVFLLDGFLVDHYVKVCYCWGGKGGL